MNPLLYCSSYTDTHHKLMDSLVSGACYLTGGVFDCNIAHHRSWQYYDCMLYNIRCNPVHPLYCVLPVPYVKVLVTRGALVAHRSAEPRN